MRAPRLLRLALLPLVFCLSAYRAAAITLHVDYTYDTSGFFAGGNPQGSAAGAQAKAAVEAAANFYSVVLTNTFSGIHTPPEFDSTHFDGKATWEWTMNFFDPTTDAPIVRTNPTVAANEYIIYVGAGGLPEGVAGQGGPGGFGWSAHSTGSFTQQEIDQINLTTDNFQNAVERRGQPSGFARWGGTIAFDNDSTPWLFNRLAVPSGNVTDFYSVALHELAHALGFGASTEWQNLVLVNEAKFNGQNSKNLNGNLPVPLSADLGHWDFNTMSVVYGKTAPQEALMDPDLQNGTRKKLTELDAAGLKDIGWLTGPPPTGVDGDYNNNGVVDAADFVLWRRKLGQNVTLPNDTTPGVVQQADYTVWRVNFGSTAAPGSGSGFLVGEAAIPEPATALLAVMTGIVPCFTRSKLRR